MKTILKYITLLIFSGVIIPLYQPCCRVKHQQAKISPTTPADVINPAQHNNGFHLYFMNDVLAKILPFADFFK